MNWKPAKQMPNYDGDYLCHIVKQERCGTFSKYQRVVNCSYNKWAIDEVERITHWQELPPPPDRSVVLLNNQIRIE